MTNELRTNPTYFISYLEERLDYFDEDNILWLPDSDFGLITWEGTAAVEEAIEFLMTKQPLLTKYEWRSGMAHAC